MGPALFLLLTAPAGAADLYVGPDDPFRTLADALAAAEDGDVVLLRAGAHTGGVVVDGDVTIRGLSGVGLTVVQSPGGAAITVDVGAVLTLDALTLDGAGVGRALDVRAAAVVDAVNVTLTGGVADAGAGLRIDGGVVTLTDAVVVANAASGAGGGAQVLGRGDLVVSEGRWLRNSALSGGALALEDGTVSLTDVTLDHNEAVADGGAIWSLDALEIRSSSLCANTADGLGGGIAVAGGSTIAEAVAFVENAGGAVQVDAAADLRNVSVLGSLGDAVVNRGELTFRDSVVAWTEGTGLVGVAPAYALLWANTVDSDGPLDFTVILDRDPILRGLSLDGACGDSVLPDPDSPLIDAGDPDVRDPDRTAVDLGATGGPSAVAAHWDDLDGDGTPALLDCDDSSGARSPLVAEIVADGVDQDCDTRDACWVDDDGDGYGSADSVQVPGRVCDLHAGVSGLSGDCDDADPTRSPGRMEVCGGGDDDCDLLVDDDDPSLDPLSVFIWFRDADGDGHGDLGDRVGACAPPDGYVGNSDDCDDGDPDISPDGIELVGDGVDQDCDGLEVCYRDLDGDGWGIPELEEVDVFDCTEPGVSDRGGDCDDADPTRNPAAREVCGGGDDDCDELADDDDPSLIAEPWFVDGDGDGDGDPATAAAWCDPPPSLTPTGTDCDDADPDVQGLDVDGDGWSSCDGDCVDTDLGVYPDAEELCDGVDQDCDGVTDDGLTGTTWWADADADGFGDADSPTEACGAPPGHVGNADDCDDTADRVFPGAPAVVDDGIDQDCDGVDECWQDGDGDGVGGDLAVPAVEAGCTAPGQSAVTGDCDDGDPARTPGAVDIPGDGIDQDCSGTDAHAVGTTPPAVDTGEPGGAAKSDLPPGWFCATTGAPEAGWWGVLALMVAARRR